MESTLYARCPGCAEQSLVIQTVGSLGCAACGFDYATLGADRAKLDAWVTERLREGVGGQLAVLFLYPRLLRIPQAAAVAQIRLLAERAGVALPEAASGPGKTMLVVAIGIVFVVVAIIAVLVWVTS